jgi:CO/xanthine dehydrogenase Mo-binding subunit
MQMFEYLPVLPEVCRAQLSLSTSSARHLRLAAHSNLNAAESLLREALAEARAAPKQQQATLDMCAGVLVEDVLLRQNNNLQSADAVLREYKAELSPETAKVCSLGSTLQRLALRQEP